MSVRVYVPTTLAALAGFFSAGSIPESVERFVAEDDTEEAEYAALDAAADASAGLLDGPGRRVVVVAELADPDNAVPVRRWVSVHADTDAVDPSAGDLPDLGWYALQELPDLLA